MESQKEKMARMTGQMSGEKTNFFKLNEVLMSGDDGSFKLRELLAEKKQDEKSPVHDLGKELRGVVLRMRWKLSKYKEEGDTGSFISSTEYDSKNTDKVIIFPSKDKGIAVQMKEKYGLGTQRVVYFYLPERDEVVRLNIKASGLTGDKNPDPVNQMGLFEYMDYLTGNELIANEVITICTGVHRADPKGNKRKDYFATSFAPGPEVEDKEKMQGLTEEIWNKTQPTEPRLPTKESEPQDETGAQNEAMDKVIDDSEIPF